MTKTQKREAWIAIRERGLVRFVLLNGVVRWGLPLAILWSLFVYFDGGGSRLDALSGIGLAFVAFPALGALISAVLWTILDRKYGPRGGLRT